MSAIALILNRDGKPVESGYIETLIARMKHRGVDGADSWQHKHYALGQQNFLVNTEDVVCPLAVKVADGTICIAFDGRLDNRDDLIRAINVGPEIYSDAELVIKAYRHWGIQCFMHLRGSFALILVDTSAFKVLLYRNHLGSRELYYHISAQHVLAATEPAAILSHSAVRGDTDDLWITNYFANFLPATHHTVFVDIQQLLPGECLLWQPDKVSVFREQPLIGRKQFRFGNDKEYAEHYRGLLQQAVSRVCRSSGSVGIMLSGGMDSVPAAYFARDYLASSNQQLTAYSWSLQQFPDADESATIEAICKHASLDLVMVPGDHCWPLSNPGHWPLSPNTPVSNAFQRLKDCVYVAAAQNQCKVLLNAAVGDLLYPGSSYWLVEALWDGQWRLFLTEFYQHLHHLGFSGVYKDNACRLIIKRIIGWQARAKKQPLWLTDEAKSIYRPCLDWPPEASTYPRPDHYCSMMGMNLAGMSTSVNYFTNPLGIELCDPYLDWDLADFMLSIPSYRCYRRGNCKLIARNALKGIMLERVRVQSKQGNLTSFYMYGIFSKSRSWISKLLMAHDAEWSRYVDKAWIEKALVKTNPSEIDVLVIWQCVSYEMWRKKYVV
jgi:asparagine synthase (glutamine-hydrolysing)